MPRIRTFTCPHCGQQHPTSEGKKVRGVGWVCNACLPQHYKQCSDCGEWLKPTVRNFKFVYDPATDSERLVCKKCVAERYDLCALCGRWHKRDGMHDVRLDQRDLRVCETCFGNNFVECPECHRLVPRGQTMHTPNDGPRMCRECWEARYFNCRGCGSVYTRDHDDGHGYCERCHDAHEEQLRRERNSPHSYHWGRSNNWYTGGMRVDGEPSDAMLFGVELEMDNGTFDFDKMGDGDVLYHFERDGSLGYNGVECITQPCTWRFHKEEFPWRRLLQSARECGFKSHDTTTCGLHVHMGKGAFLDKTLEMAVDLFVNRNIDKWELVARRSSERWAKGKKDKTVDEATRSVDYPQDRYQAVNHLNRNTVEIRIAKGSLKYETVLGTIGLYAAMCRFLKDKTPEDVTNITGATWEKFVHYVCDNFTTYPESVELLARKGNEELARQTLALMNADETVRQFEERNAAIDIDNTNNTEE